jgi:hypothetical protein
MAITKPASSTFKLPSKTDTQAFFGTDIERMLTQEALDDIATARCR